MIANVKAKSVGRPAAFSDKAVICINSAKAKNKLQVNSDRRAVINQIIEMGGKATLDQLNKHFGFEMRPTVLSLIGGGWLCLENDK